MFPLGVMSDVLSTVLFWIMRCPGFLRSDLRSEIIVFFNDSFGLINHIARIDYDARPKWVFILK
jgi:hypothetical protein